jgi:branched-chain amino acid transport system substrate-binding protein
MKSKAFLAAACLVALAACGDKKDAPAAAGGSGGAIKIGVAGPMTGGQAKNGEDLMDGTTMAVEEINAKGGVLGRKIEIVTRDDMADAKNAPAAAQQLVGEHVVGVIGHFNSGSTIPASEIYHKNGIVTITPASTNEFVTDRKYDDVFRVCGRDDQQSAKAAEFVVNELKAKRVAILDDQTAYGKGLADGFERNVKGKTTIALREHFDTKERNFRPDLNKLKEANVDLWYFGGIYEQAAPMLMQAKQLGIAAPMMSGDGVHGYVKEFLEVCGKDADGTFTTFPATNPAFVETYKKRFAGKEPGPYAIFSYTATKVLAEAIAKAGSTEGPKVAQAIHAGKFDTPIGMIEFDEKGDVKDRAEGKYVVWVVKDGKHVQYSAGR